MSSPLYIFLLFLRQQANYHAGWLVRHLGPGAVSGLTMTHPFRTNNPRDCTDTEKYRQTGTHARARIQTRAHTCMHVYTHAQHITRTLVSARTQIHARTHADKHVLTHAHKKFRWWRSDSASLSLCCWCWCRFSQPFAYIHHSTRATTHRINTNAAYKNCGLMFMQTIIVLSTDCTSARIQTYTKREFVISYRNLQCRR